MHSRFASSLSFFVVCLLGLVGCGPTLGERAAQHACPDGEVCFTTCPSGGTCSRAVDGLVFQGTSRTGDRPRVGIVAVHGEERVTLFAGGAPYTDPVLVTTDPPGVLTATLVAPSLVVLHGDTAGTTHLRILEPTTMRLLDRVEVHTHGGDPVVRVPALDERTFTHELVAEFAVRAGARVPFSVSLATLWFSIDPVVDTTLEVRDARGALLLSGLDGAPYDLPLTAPGSTFTLSLRGVGTTITQEIPVVDHFDELHVFADAGMVGGATQGRVCVIPITAGVPVYTDEAPVFAAPDWSVTPSAEHEGCADVTRPGTHDTIDLTVSLGGLSVARSVPVGP